VEKWVTICRATPSVAATQREIQLIKFRQLFSPSKTERDTIDQLSSAISDGFSCSDTVTYNWSSFVSYFRWFFI
jgi:hypothetical protein